VLGRAASCNGSRRHVLGLRSASSAVSSQQACLDVVRGSDASAYFSGLLLPRPAQRGFFAVRALNSEVAKVAELTAYNERTAALRFQWWRDAINFAYTGEDDAISNPSQHPVALELRRAVQEHNLTRRWLERLVDQREETLTLKQLGSLEDLEMYSELTSSSLMYLNLELVGVRDATADHAASHVGKAIGIAQSLRAMPIHHINGLTWLPGDTMIKHGLRIRGFRDLVDHALEAQGLIKPTKAKAKALEEEAASAGPKIPATESLRLHSAPKIPDMTEEDFARVHGLLVDVTFDVASQAHLHLEHARDMRDKLPKEAITAMLPATWAGMYLKRLESVAHFDPLHPALLNDPFSQVRLQWNLLKNKFSGTF